MLNLKCPVCSNEFTTSQGELNKRLRKGKEMCCSHKCGNTLNASLSLITLNCLECNLEFVRRKCDSKGNNFCSKSCACSYNNKLLRSGENHPNYITGVGSYRKKALDTYGDKCELCDFDKSYAIEVHHIDENRLNNKITNLIVLCANCHSGIHRNKEMKSKLKEYLNSRFEP